MKKYLFVIIIAYFIFLVGCAGSHYVVSGRERGGKGKPITIRVAIEKDINKITLATKYGVIISNDKRYKLPNSSNILFEDGVVVINGSRYNPPVYIESPNKIVINEKEYPGSIILEENLVVNMLSIEDYLKGVLSQEVSDSWPLEALKAQAIVSRTYAYKKVLESKNICYDIENTEMHQKYNYEDKNININSAISKTRGIIILYNNRPIEAFFHASSGGITENSNDIFQQSLSYLKNIPDPYSINNDKSRWNYRVSGKNIKNLLKDVISDNYKNIELKDIKINSKTASGRTRDFLLIFNANKTLVVKGNLFRLYINPKEFKSLLIDNIEKEIIYDDYLFTFSGIGYGHGVGMSQLGAKKMSEIGFNYEDIIKYYYRGTSFGNYTNLHLNKS